MTEQNEKYGVDLSVPDLGQKCWFYDYAADAIIEGCVVSTYCHSTVDNKREMLYGITGTDNSVFVSVHPAVIGRSADAAAVKARIWLSQELDRVQARADYLQRTMRRWQELEHAH